jgi:bacterioferritin-associated ferredoxin
MNKKDELIICRCESVKLGQIQSSIHRSGAQTVNQVKKLTRAGMGLCQGRTCAKVVESILAAEGNMPQGREPYLVRPPVRAVAVDSLAIVADHYAEPAGPVKIKATRSQASDSISQKSEKINKNADR